MPEAVLSQPVTSDHIPGNGRFAKGNRAQTGNEIQLKTANFRKLELSCISKKDLKAIIKQLVKMALGGDFNAAKFLVERACNRLPNVNEIAVATGADGEPKTITIQLEGIPAKK